MLPLMLLINILVCAPTHETNKHCPLTRYFWVFDRQGVPLRMELGPRDMENETFFVARRDTGEKVSMAWGDVGTAVPALLETVQREMLERARKDETTACVRTKPGRTQ